MLPSYKLCGRGHLTWPLEVEITVALEASVNISCLNEQPRILMADPRKGFFVSRNRMRVWWPSHSELQRWNAEQGKRWRRHIHSELTPSPQTSLLLPGKETEVQRAEATCGKSHSGRAWTTAWAPPAPGLRLLTRAPHHEALHWPLTRPSAL